MQHAASIRHQTSNGKSKRNQSRIDVIYDGKMEDTVVNKPVRNMREFIERDNEEQSKFNDGQYNDHVDLLNGNDWPRVEELDVDEDESEDVNAELEGIVSPGTKELQLLSEFVSKISSSLRLDSQKEKIELTSETSMADEAVKGSDVFITNLPKQTGQKKMDFAHIYNSKVVEAAVFPGLDADATKLPNNVVIGDIIQTAVGKFQSSSKKLPKKWIKLFCSKSSCQIVSDSFWYIWHHRFNSDDQIQQKLIERISNVFVGFFVGCKLSSQSKDEFFKLYPNVMSISVWYGFMESFPKSQKHFGLTFQTIICDSLAEWIMGIVPVNPWCLEWNALESKAIKAEAAKVEPVVSDAVTASNQDLIMFPSKNDQDEKVEKKENAGFHKYHGSLIVHRSQVIRETSDPNIPTYRQIINESIKNAASYFQEYKEKIKRAGREKLSIIQETNAYISHEESQQRKIMNNPNLIKEKAHSVLQEMAQSAKKRKEKILAKRKQGKVII